MSFDVGNLLGSLFPEVTPARMPERPDPEPLPAAAPSPELTADRGYRESPEVSNGRENAKAEPVFSVKPRKRPPNALPTPPAGEWLAMWRLRPQTTPPPKPCGWCGCPVFWQHAVGRVFLCSRCKPPAFPAHALAWVQVVATEDGPAVVRIDGPEVATDDENRRFNHGR
jgi:hypothetical protein